MSGFGWERVDGEEDEAPSEARKEAPVTMEWRPPTPYRPLARRAKWTIALLVVGIVVDLVAVGSDVAERMLLNDAAAGKILTDAQVDANDVRQGVVGGVQALVFTLTAVAFLFWFNRAYRNLTALGATGLRYGYGWAVGAWFVPILNLFRPKQIANDVWRASEPEAPPGQGSGWHGDDVPALYFVWWLAYLVMNFLYSTSVRLRLRAEDIGQLQTASSFFLAADIAGVVAGVLAVVVVRRTTARQTERAARLDVVPEEDPEPLWRRGSAWAALFAVLGVLALQGLITAVAWSGALLPAQAEVPTPRTPSGAAPGTLFADDFSQEDVWLVEDEGGQTFDYVDGEYRLLLRGRNAFWSSLLALPREVDSLALEVDATLHAGRAQDDFYGLACLGSSQGAYLFGISPDGYYTIGVDPGGDEELALDRLVEEFGERFSRNDGSNRLRAECSNEGGRARLTLSVNGAKLAETRDRGNLGEYVGMGLFVFSRRGGTDVRFDDFVARELRAP